MEKNVAMIAFSQSQVKIMLSRLFSRVRYEVEGIDHIPRQGPAILIMNHTGWEEILFTILAISRPLKIVGMRELIYLDEAASMARVFDTGYAKDFGPLRRHLAILFGNLLGRAIRRQFLEFGYIPTKIFTDTWRPALGSNGIREVVRVLEEGNVVLFFPEGGYRRDGVMRPFKPGLGLILRLLGRRGIQAPVIPAAQHTADSISIKLNNRYIPRLVFGRPLVFSIDRHSSRAFDEETVGALQGEVNALLPLAWPDHPPQTYCELMEQSVPRAVASEYSRTNH
jgi:1-acyl-sn-glycerol-3-phosphate acyltransferase